MWELRKILRSSIQISFGRALGQVIGVKICYCVKVSKTYNIEKFEDDIFDY